MTRMFNDPRVFKDEMIDGFVAAYGRYVRRAPGASGIIAADAPAADRVAVVIGGGAGHYPAFYGFVGRGMASAAAIGDVFTSPSGEQVYRVAKAADGGAGILFSFGNYSGDVLNFGMTETRLRSEGIDARTVLVTDDVLSAPPAEEEKRRGIAGGFYVFKTAGASAARGDDLATVEALTRLANSRVRTVGVAFAGCTIPGQSEPLFTVDPSQMEVGLGIHGEPGVRMMERLPARAIAKLLVDAILAAAPARAGGRVAVLVNGLGATKYEELFVLYHGIAPLLREAGIDVHETNIGEFVTSLDMAGCSLTLFWLDDELQALHDATAVSPAYTRIGANLGGTRTASAPQSRGMAVAASSTQSSGEEGQPGTAGVVIRAAISGALRAMEEAEAELGQLDAAAGDGDHGAGMVRGFSAAVAALNGFGGTARQSLVRAGGAFMDAAGGASGALVGSWLMAMGSALPTDDDAVDAASWVNAFTAGSITIQRLGQAAPGDKTMLDTLDPFARFFAGAVSSGANAASAWSTALPAAEAGMQATTEMVSRRGRAARLGERSRGRRDAGATSIYYVLSAFGRALSGGSDA